MILIYLSWVYLHLMHAVRREMRWSSNTWPMLPRCNFSCVHILFHCFCLFPLFHALPQIFEFSLIQTACEFFEYSVINSDSWEKGWFLKLHLVCCLLQASKKKVRKSIGVSLNWWVAWPKLTLSQGEKKKKKLSLQLLPPLHLSRTCSSWAWMHLLWT